MNNEKVYAQMIANMMQLPVQNVNNTLLLLNEGCTIPFISRYRKERTGGMDEVGISNIFNLQQKLIAIEKRKEAIKKAISEQGKLTNELESKIDACWDAVVLEDLYQPYKTKRRTKAQVAREQGLEPLAQKIMAQQDYNIEKTAQQFLKGEIKDIECAIKGAQYIIAENINENVEVRQKVRAVFDREAVISSKVIKDKAEEERASVYADYFDFTEPLKKCSSHRLLAIRRGETEGILRVNISPENDEVCTNLLERQFIRKHGACRSIIQEAISDAYKRLLKPSIETEIANISKEKADEEAISVFAENLKQLLLSAPLGQKRVMALDPGFRTGCKLVCLDAQGKLLYHDVIYPHPPKNEQRKAAATMQELLQKYKIEAIAIGNGTAGRETERFVRDLNGINTIPTFMVNEDGASVYSASKIAREEFPQEDVTVRGAVSIGRRLMDPLAELIKIDPQSIGVGQYQHDVNQKELKQKLDQTVEYCVNLVGVNVNTASSKLLTYVSGLGPVLAKNIVEYRNENGMFTSRAQLKKVPRLGMAAFTQCAGFLRVPGAKNALDNTAVHPESYKIVEQMAKDNFCTVNDLIKNKEKRGEIDLKKYVSQTIGMPTLIDIFKELEKPGLDPRDSIEEFKFENGIEAIDDLKEGMVLPGKVTNITKFGVFVDIGIHQDGLVHISQLADKFVKDPLDVVKLNERVKVRVINIDKKRNRISLSMRL